MLLLALTCFAFAALAALLGFTSVTGVSLTSARVLFFVFVALTLVALIAAAWHDVRQAARFRASSSLPR
jgi:uncharacterized membrane protein YtjA (UPF0391 family)